MTTTAPSQTAAEPSFQELARRVDEAGPGEGGVSGGGAELGAAVDVVVHAALDLDVGADQFPPDHGAVGLDGGELGVESQAALALLVGGDADQPDQPGRHRRFSSPGLRSSSFTSWTLP